MKRSYSGHVPVRVPDGTYRDMKMMVIQINNLFDDLYRRVIELQREVEKLKEEGEDDG